jgi:hypothetical protein
VNQAAHGLEVWIPAVGDSARPKAGQPAFRPFERAEREAGDYDKWFIEYLFVFVSAQAIAAQHLATFQEFRRGRLQVASRSTDPWKC